jgi:predicted pyridoxine 5'-phosphate oxidase superfamily flavin-nucleotide-binding protein
MITTHQITDKATLKAVLSEPMEFVSAKFTDILSGVTCEFIQTSPLVSIVSQSDWPTLLDQLRSPELAVQMVWAAYSR